MAIGLPDDSSGNGQHASPRSKGYLAYLLILLATANALSYADRQLFAILAPAIKADFDISDTMVGLLGGPAFMIAFVLLSLPLARLADSWSRRRVLAISAAVWSLMTAACGLAANGWQLAIARIGIGMGEAGGSPSAQSIIAGSFPPERRAGALSIFSSGVYVGSVVALAGGALLADAVGWRMTFIILAAPGFLVSILVWFTAPRRSAQPQPPSQRVPVTMRESAARCWRVPTFRMICLACGALGIFSYALMTWMPSYLIRSHGLTLIEIGLWLGIGSTIGGILGTLMSGALVDRLVLRDPRWQLRVPALGVVLSLPFITLQLLMPGGVRIDVLGLLVPLVALPSPLHAFFVGAWMPPAMAATANLMPPALRAQAAAILIIVLTVLGAGLGPLLTGMLSDALAQVSGVESLRHAIVASLGTLVVSAALFWRASVLYPDDLARSVRNEH